MKKLLISLAAAGILAGCSADDSEMGQEGPPDTEVKTEEISVTTDYLQDRFYEGMDYAAYAVEIQAWVEKGEATISDSVEIEGKVNGSADIIQVADGFLAVANDGNKITLVKTFPSPEKAKEYLNNNL